MTALSGPIVFNNSGSGSDTAASGCPANSTAVSVMIQTSAGSNTATASWTGTISAGDLMYIPDSSFTGRRYNVIASVGSGGSLTFDNNWDDSSFGTSGYVGGKRAGSNLSGDAIQSDAPDGAVIEIEYTGSDYAMTGNFAPSLGSQSAPVTFKGTGSGQPRITSPTGNVNCVRLGAGSYIFENLAWVCKKIGSAIDVFLIYDNVTRTKFVDCTFKSEQSTAGGSLFSDTRNSTHVGIFQNCIFDGNNLAYRGFRREGGSAAYAPQNLVNCTFKNMSSGGSPSAGIYFSDSRSCVVRGCIFENTVDGIYFRSDSWWQNFLEQNIIYNLSGNGVNFESGNQLIACRYEHNIFSGITGHAFTANLDYTGEQKLSLFDRNAFHNVTGSTHNNLSAGPNDITLSSDPFVDASNGNFTVNSDTLKEVSYSLNDDTKVHPFSQFMTPVVDSSQPQEAGTQVMPFGQWSVTNPEAQLHPLRSS